MKLEDTITGFREILDGKHDDLPEQAFYMVGTIEEAVEKGALAGEEPSRAEPRPSRAARPTASPRSARQDVLASRSSRRTAPAFEGEAEMLIVPGADGEIGVLARHAPLIATLKAGSTRVHLGEGDERVREFATGPGFFKVEQDRAIALVDDAVARERDRRRRAPRRSSRRRRPSSSGSSAASPRRTAGRSSSASGTPRTSSTVAGARRELPRCRAGCAICGIGRTASSCWKHWSQLVATAPAAWSIMRFSRLQRQV